MPRAAEERAQALRRIEAGEAIIRLDGPVHLHHDRYTADQESLSRNRGETEAFGTGSLRREIERARMDVPGFEELWS